MKRLTDRQRAVLRYLERVEMPCTVREIADDFNAPGSGVRSVLASLKRYGCVEVRGVSMNGGTTWGVVLPPTDAP